MAIWACREYVFLEIHRFSWPESHRRWPERLLEVGLRDSQFWVLENFLSMETQFRGANFEGSYLLIQRLSGKSASMVRQRVCRGRERWSQLAGKPPDERVTASESGLVRQDFQAGRQAAPAGWHAASRRQPCGGRKITVLVPELLCNLILTPKLK